jgi:hypothetical protein
LACVFRVAELRGDSNLARRALLCLIRGIDLRLSLAEENAWSRPVVQELGQHVREFFVEWQTAMTESHEPVDISTHLLEHTQFEDGYIM